MQMCRTTYGIFAGENQLSVLRDYILINSRTVSMVLGFSLTEGIVLSSSFEFE